MKKTTEHRKEMQEYTLLLVEAIQKTRNTFLAGIGFAIGLLVSLIVLGIFDKGYTWYIIIGIIAGACIFFVSNISAMKIFSKNEKIMDELQTSETIVYHLQNLILEKAFEEKLTKEQVSLLAKFVDILITITSYNFDLLHHKIFKSEKPDKIKYSETYKTAKENLADFNTLNLKNQVAPIETFIKNFETEECKNKIKSETIKL